jgi:hypothetical protein
MIYTCLKFQDEPPLNYQYTLKSEEQEGKTGLVQGWVAVGVARA